ncbi:hypothetical protein O181_029632 [Austropuccinia psidii MF-1]|uniref:Integrase zinc-binding domain-containing protein n=1 Tax=Austropuccinia psidii MF-1 TaxID=1389203 RepID=A0A9Q3CWZ6_9BASI|nr:hypothetical protein [Austropuccinia psidii MF-1]
MSLLSSRDEVFKEIQDFGEDNSVSSLHLFFGKMDLPPLSYHDSPEESWDEEEEPKEVETVMKVVTSAYHQYLDVFSKVKAEKLPPHCACDHHIKLEGSTLYQTKSPIHSGPKFQGMKNKYPVPPINQLLTVFNGSSIFSKIDLCGAYSLLRIKEGDEHLTAFRTKYCSYEHLVVASLNHIMVFCKSEEEHVTDVWTVLSRLRANTLFAKAFKCLFHVSSKKLWQDPQYRSILQELGKGKSVQDYSLDSSSQLLLFKDQVVVTNEPTIQLRILQKCHDSPLAGHPGQDKTLKLVKWDFHWSGMTQFIKDYVSSFQQCSRNKNIHHKKLGLLEPLPIPNGPWICLSMDFITQFLLSNSLNLVIVIVDRFSKMEVFIPTMSSITSLYLAHFFIKNIFSKNSLPSRIKLKISRDLSTAYRPETDGQTGRVNQILEQHLWMYFSYHQYYWNTCIPLAELAHNNSDHSSTKQSPFFTVYGRDFHFDSSHITQDTPAGKLSTKIQSLQKDVKRELEVAINRFKRYSDKSRASTPVFNPGDMVWLSPKNIKSTRPT